MLEKVYESEYSTAFGNRGIANLLYNWGRLYSDPEEAMRVYTRAVLRRRQRQGPRHDGRDAGQRRRQPADEEAGHGRRGRAGTAGGHGHGGFYDESGDWMYTAGLPAKTGVGGGIVAVVPGRFAIAAFSPRLNEAGNSVRSLNAIRDIAGELGVGVFGPNPN